MTRTIPRFDTAMPQRAQRIVALTLASVAFAAPGLAQAQAAAPTTQQQASDKAAADAFKRADANQDGKLSRDEAVRLPAIAGRFDGLDKDKDGALSLEEFMAGYMK